MDIKYEILDTDEGIPTLMVSMDGKTALLHSRVRPSREASGMKDSFDPGKFDFLIVLGTGLGYHLAPLRDIIDSYSKILLVDVIGGIEKMMPKNGPASFLLESDRAVFVTGKDEEEIENALTALLDFDSIKGVSVLEHPASVRFFEKYYSGIKKAVDRVIQKKAGDGAARKAFGALYFRNIIKNSSILGDLQPIIQLAGAFAGMPAVVVTSGPSLENHLKDIKSNMGVFFTICVDSAFPVLHGSGIKPDIVISTDPQPYVAEHLQEGYGKVPVRIFSISSSHDSVKKHGGFIHLNTHPLSQIISGIAGEIGSVDSLTGTVAGDAIRLAEFLGFKTAALIGFDFSFTGFKIYSRGTAYQNRYSLYFQDRTTPVETRNLGYIMKSSGGFRQYGRFTRRSFMSYRESIEKMIRYTVTMPVNVNMEGPDIKGAKKMNFSDFIADCCGGKIDRDGIMKKALGVSGKTPMETAGRLRASLGDREILHAVLEESLPKSYPKKPKMKDFIKKVLGGGK
ncbi:MAG: DUF115 domain-containing protein [Spirochaetes bacterium]|nr:DUF115 domain-containing protein [Spirochaetota bacterium]